MSRPPTPAGWVTLEEAARRLRVTPQTARRWCRDRRLPGAKRQGRRWVLPEQAVREAAVPAFIDGPERQLMVTARLLQELQEAFEAGAPPDGDLEIALDELWRRALALRSAWPE